jgi:hypothetical protein
LIAPDAPRELAAQQIVALDSPSHALRDLAAAGQSEAISELVDQLAASEPNNPEEKLRQEWLYLVLAWIYEHRASDTDPLQRVAEVYADFGYPEEIAAFVRYMPMVGPDLGSRSANENRLFERWRKYLDETGQKMRISS